LPCLAHNLQLVIKDGLNLDKDFEKLINHVSSNIVSKSKQSSIIAAELRKLNKKLNKKNITRWNSILFMVRSVLKISTEQLNSIRNSMPSRNKKELEAKNKFKLSDKEREMLEELKDVLEMFEFVTDEFQSNKINISRVYPAVKYLRDNLIPKDDNNQAIKYNFTNKLRKDLLESLDKRFGSLVNDDVFLVSTFLDPNFGLGALHEDIQEIVKAKIIALVKIGDAKQVILNTQNANNIIPQKEQQLIDKRKVNYKKQKISQFKPLDKYVDMTNEYICHIDQLEYDGCPLKFWKENEARFPVLAEIARKYLGVPASSAAVERMFSISGHILSNKRTKMSIQLFCYLVFLKLNENFL